MFLSHRPAYRLAGSSALFVLLGGALPGSAYAVNVSFDYSFDTGSHLAADGSSVNGFFTEGVTYEDGSTGEQRRAVLEAAASYYESALSDSLSAINPTGGVNSWNAVIANPSTGNNTTLSNLQIGQDEVRVYVGARDFSAAALAGPGGLQVVQGTDFSDTVINRGQGDTRGADANDFSLWGGTIAFDSNINVSGFDLDWHWGIDTTDGLDSSSIDFLSVAVHELAHVFGFGLADSYENQVVTENGESFFVGENAVSVFGSYVPLTEADGGAHLEDGLNADSQALDPTIRVGERKLLNELEYAILADIGWEVSPNLISGVVAVPSPRAFGGTLVLLGLLMMGRKRGTLCRCEAG